MLDDILLNPEAAAALIKTNNPANRREAEGMIKLWFGGNAAISILNALSARDGD